MRILLVSTYELGHQPLHVALPAAALRRRGHAVTTLDLAVEAVDWDAVDDAEAVAVSVPMHTATRLALSLVEEMRGRGLETPVAFFGLYAGVGAEGADIDRAISGEYLPEIVAWIEGLDAGDPVHGVSVFVGRSPSWPVPDRSSLPGLGRYAHLEVDGARRMVGSVEASRGCRHRCRHCPLPSVYDGRYRVVPVVDVVADVDRLVEAGAEHVTFGDPDFWNGPAHAMRVLEAVHARHPHLTFDLTIKVEHLLAHPDLVARLPGLGVLFVVSAFESVSNEILGYLAKGHTAADLDAAVALCREAGLDLHPSWLPFTPWTTPADIVGIFDFLDRHDLVAVADPVQLSIRLLVPPGSLLLDLPEMAPYLGEYDPGALSYRWRSSHPVMDDLQAKLAALAAAGTEAGADPVDVVVDMWRVALDRLGADPSRACRPAGGHRARLTESWFCCAEPTEAQVAVLSPTPSGR